ncbi:hypothetical protein ONZ45_g15446 [Pleurotus djamor]|nr:hypothetical protein ONZ45_g15446 [Pleurotus djamor]
MSSRSTRATTRAAGRETLYLGFNGLRKVLSISDLCLLRPPTPKTPKAVKISPNKSATKSSGDELASVAEGSDVDVPLEKLVLVYPGEEPASDSAESTVPVVKRTYANVASGRSTPAKSPKVNKTPIAASSDAEVFEEETPKPARAQSTPKASALSKKVVKTPIAATTDTEVSEEETPKPAPTKGKSKASMSSSKKKKVVKTPIAVDSDTDASEDETLQSIPAKRTVKASASLSSPKKKKVVEADADISEQETPKIIWVKRTPNTASKKIPETVLIDTDVEEEVPPLPRRAALKNRLIPKSSEAAKHVDNLHRYCRGSRSGGITKSLSAAYVQSSNTLFQEVNHSSGKEKIVSSTGGKLVV